MCMVLFGLRVRFHSNILRTHTPARCFCIEYNKFMWISCPNTDTSTLCTVYTDIYHLSRCIHVSTYSRLAPANTQKKKRGAYRNSRKHENLLPHMRAATYTHALKTYVYTCGSHIEYMPTTLPHPHSLSVKTKTPREKGGWHSGRENCHYYHRMRLYTITRWWMSANRRWPCCIFFIGFFYSFPIQSICHFILRSNRLIA